MLPIAFLGNPLEIGMIVGLIALLFGGAKLASLGKGLGEGIKEFKKATTDDEKPTVAPPVTPAAAYPEPAAPVGSRTEDK